MAEKIHVSDTQTDIDMEKDDESDSNDELESENSEEDEKEEAELRNKCDLIKEQEHPVKRVKKYKVYSASALIEAYKFVLETGIPIKTAARHYGVPHNTLRDRVKGRVDPESLAPGPGPLFTLDEEVKLVQHIKHMADLGYGFTSSEVVSKASDYAVFLKKRSRDKPLSVRWFSGFRKRWPELRVGKPRKSKSRAASTTQPAVDSKIANLESVIRDNNLLNKPQCIFNIDEKGLQTGHSSPYIVSGGASVPAINSSRSALTTVIGGGNAIGTPLPPFFVFKGQRMNKDLLQGAPPGSAGTVSETGWSDSVIFHAYFETHFFKHIQRQDPSQPVLVIFDGHTGKSQINVPVLEWAQQNNIILFILPAHTSNCLQPLDVGCFGLLQKIYNNTCHKFFKENPSSKITKFKVAALASSSYLTALSKNNLIAAFKETGIFSHDKSDINTDNYNPPEPHVSPVKESAQSVADSQRDLDDVPCLNKQAVSPCRKPKCFESKIKENPYMYENHVELIKKQKTLGDLDQLRVAREQMSSLFPLTEDLWLDWLKDESSLASEPSDRDKVTKLYRRAVKDYLSVPIWLEFVQFAIGGMGQDGIQSVRGVFDDAITSCGLHVTKGANLWEAYREFESAILSGLLPDPGSVPTKEQEDKFSEQHDRVSSLFKRQLTVPLFDMEETWEEYSDWLQEEPDNYCKQAYKKASNKLNKVKPYEDNVFTAEAPRLQEYQDYIQYEEKEGDPARIQCLYERSLQENCLNPTLWLQYTKYLDRTLKVSSVSIPVYERSVRNCPWCVQLWQNYILCLERADKPYEEVKDVFEGGLTCGFSQGSEYLLLWTTFIDYLRRRIKWTEDHTEDLETFRLTMGKAIEQIDSYGTEGDPNGTLRQFWAVIEAKHCNNMEKARTLWAEVMAAGRANEAALWMEYYRFERAFGDNKHCRRVLQRALNSVTDWPESIVDAYVNFEREEGTLEQYDQAVSKCEAQMARINERREKAEADTSAQNKKKFDKNQQRKTDNKQRHQKSNTAKQKQTEGETQQIKPYKRNIEETSPSGNGFKVPDVPAAKVSKSSPPPGFKGKTVSAPPPGFQEKSAPPPGSQEKSAPPPGFQEKSDTSPEFPEKSAPPPGFKRDRSAALTNSVEQSAEEDQPEAKKLKTDQVMPTSDSESRTVFVSNLSFAVDEDQLKTFFTKCGPIDEIRLVKNFKGKSKGYAYIQFADQFAVVKALTYDRTPIDNRPMYVSKYEDRSHKNKADFKYSTNLEKNKLFIKNLPFTCTKEALETLFSQHGELKDVRLVTYKSGQPKGLAYVDYVDEQCATQAILKTDGVQIGEHTISVALSNPPMRKDPSWKREETSFVPSLGGGKKDTQNRGNARTQVMLMPRSVTKKSQAQTKPAAGSSGTAQPAGKDKSVPSSNTESNSSSTDSTSKGLSNTDFRQLLLKK